MLRIAGPAVLEALFLVIVATIDTKMISALGNDYISAVSLTISPRLLILCIFYALGTAVSYFVSRSVGERNRERCNGYFHSILKITVILSVILGIVMALFAGPIMSICNQQPSTVEISENFYRIIMGFMVFQTSSIVMNAALRGTGNTHITMLSIFVFGVVDIFLNFLLIEGNWGCPRLEETGDAIATVAGTAAACAVSLCYIIRKSEFLSMRHFLTRKIFTGRAQKKEILSKASNVIFENIFTRIGFLMTSIIISTLSSDKTAVYFVGMILMNYSFAFGDGIQSAVIALAGRSAGARKYGEMKCYVHTGHVIGLVCAAGLAAVYILSSSWFFGLYFDDSGMIADGVITSAIVGGITFVQIYRIIDIASLRACGEMKIPRFIATVCVLAVNPALALLLTQAVSMEVWSIWAATVITQIVWFAVSRYFAGKNINKLCCCSGQ